MEQLLSPFFPSLISVLWLQWLQWLQPAAKWLECG
jgi:hypothetical protein